MSLKKYHQKRNFQRTKEPFGGKTPTRKKNPRLLFVIQKHAASHLHYDFRLELDGTLKSWAVPKGPSLDPKVKHLAVHVEDHPMEYANFEGIIPKGQYGGGTVMVWDTGTWEPLDSNVKQAYYQGHLTFKLHGQRLKGVWKLIRLKSKDSTRDQWLLFKVKDEYSQDEKNYNVTENEPTSVISHRNMTQIAKEESRVWSSNKGEIKPTQKKSRLVLNLKKIVGVEKSKIPSFVSPELATLVTEPPAGDQWLHEIKWDGYRIQARIDAGEVTLLTRKDNDWTHQFPSLVEALKSLRLKNIILDGEVIALDKNKKSNFQILQNALEDHSAIFGIVYYIFDILYYDDYSLTGLPLIERKNILAKIMTSKVLPSEIKFNDHIIGNGDRVYQKACKLSLEGIVSKKTDSLYVSKRTKEWLKIKCNRRQEFIVCGYTDPKSSRKFFGALLLGYYNKQKQLIYCGRVGTGFSQKSLKEVSELLFKYETNKNPFKSFPERITSDIHWLQPKIVVEIEFLEITDDCILRHASFKGVRKDKKPTAVKLELAKKMSGVSPKRKDTRKL